MSKPPNKENQRVKRQNTKRESDEILLDTLLEKWELSGSYKNFFSRHVRAMGLTEIIDSEARENLKKVMGSLKALKVPWSKLHPRERSQLVARLAKQMREGDLDDAGKRSKGPKGSREEDDDDTHRNQRGRGHRKDRDDDDNKKKKKKKKIKKRHCHKPPPGERPCPPRSDPDDTGDPDEEPEVPTEPPDIPPPYEPGTPPPVDSPLPVTPGPLKEHFTSRIGYFASLSELTYYTQEPALYNVPDIEFSFQDMEDSHLALVGGDSWVSEWQEGPVIRGLDININGQHRLKYSSNGDFEIG
jgi:hypothetical protein